MFEVLIWASILVIVLGMIYAYAGSRDAFHPLMFIGPMMIFMYAWMPLKMGASGGLEGFFDNDQLVTVETINLVGILCFVIGSLSIGCRLPKMRRVEPISNNAVRVLTLGGIIVGGIGVAAWTLAIINVGGLTDAFSTAYSGGWDDNGYVRDAALMMYPGFLLIIAAAVGSGFRPFLVILAFGFMTPWMVQAALTSRRGPTFMIMVTLAMGWYMYRQKRPSLVTAGAAGLLLGFLLLFLVTNRQHIFIGSDQELTTDVSNIVEKPDNGNEFIYGAGAILSAEQRNYFYWGRRYLAQIVVRPVPHTIWPTKYEDFGLPEMTHNAGTGEGFAETLGWEGATGSAPGLIADLWLEFRWLALPVLFLLGQVYARAWRRTHLEGGPWNAQYIVMAALSIYFVMQTMEAVIFRLLELSIPIWLIWRVSGYQTKSLIKPEAIPSEFQPAAAA